MTTTIDGVKTLQIRNAKNGDFDLNLAGGGGGSSEEDYLLEVEVYFPYEGDPQATVTKYPEDSHVHSEKVKVIYKFDEEYQLDDAFNICDIFVFRYTDVSGPHYIVPMYDGFERELIIISDDFRTARFSQGKIRVYVVSSKTIPAESAKPIDCRFSILDGSNTYYPSEIINSQLVDAEHMVSSNPTFSFMLTDSIYTILALNPRTEDISVSAQTEVYTLANRTNVG